MKHRWDYIYEPDARQLVEGLVTRFIESQVYQGVVENVACEQAAKMIAMKSATDNAGDLIDELQLIMNNAGRRRSHRNYQKLWEERRRIGG